MIGVKRFIVLLMLILAAIACYSAGFNAGLWGFLVLGGVLELTFWLGIMGVDKEKA